MGVRQGGAPPYVTPAFLSFRTHIGRHTRTHTYAHALHHAPSYLRHAVKGVTPPPHPSPPGPCPPMLCGARCVIRPHVNCQYGFPKSGKWLTCHPPRGRVGQDRRGCRRAIHGRPRVFLWLQVRRPCQWSSLRFADLRGWAGDARRGRGRGQVLPRPPGAAARVWARGAARRARHVHDDRALLPEHLAARAPPEVPRRVCFASEPALGLSSIRRGDLFIIQIIRALKGSFPRIIAMLHEGLRGCGLSNRRGTVAAWPPLTHGDTSSRIR